VSRFYKIVFSSMVIACVASGKSETIKVQQEIPSVVNVFSQVVSYSIPRSFFGENMNPPISLRQANQKSFLLEIVPHDQTVEDWKEMITVTGARDIAVNTNATPTDMKNFLKSRFEQSCSNSFSYLLLKENTNDISFVASCGESGKQSESTLIKVIRGSKDFYTIQWAFHDKLSSTPIKLNKNEWTKRLDRLNPRTINK